jgi:cytochrome P450
MQCRLRQQNPSPPPAVSAPAYADPCRKPTYDLDRIPGPWRYAKPVVGNILECIRPDFHRTLLGWSDQYGGIYRLKFLWQDALVVTDPTALAAIMGRGEGAMDKASLVYAPINKMCDPHGSPNLLTSAADDTWKAIRKAVAVSFSMQVRGRGRTACLLHVRLWSQ